MPLVMQLDGPRTSPQLLGVWGDIWSGIAKVGDAVGSTVSYAWATIKHPRGVQPAPHAGVQGLGLMSAINYAAATPVLTALVGIGIGVYLASRKGKKR